MSDFPVYDGSVPPDDFIAQCQRLAALGGISTEQLSAIMTVRCRGIALQVLEGDQAQTDVRTLLQTTFGGRQPETAAAQLSTAHKGTMPVLDYSVLIQRLVRDACPELFDESGLVKKICVPAHQATLYRHFLVGLSPEERVLLSRQGANTFAAAVDELKREESISHVGGEFHRSRSVRWAESSPVRTACGGGGINWTRDLCPGASPVGAERGGYGLEAAARGERCGSGSAAHSRGERGGSGFRSLDREAPAQRGSGSRSLSGDRSRRPGGPGWQQDRATTTWRSRRQSSSSSRSPDVHNQRRHSRDRAQDGSGRRARSPAGAGRSVGRQSAERDPRGGRPSDGDGQSAGPAGERRREPQCWSCRGFGHLKRHCPNGQLGRLAGEW